MAKEVKPQEIPERLKKMIEAQKKLRESQSKTETVSVPYHKG